MNKKALIALGVIGVFGVVALMILRGYAPDLVHVAVMNSVIQKAPEGYPSGRIRQAFTRRYRAAQASASEDVYLAELKALSQRLEKVQHLSAQEVEEILEKLRAD